MSRSRKKNPVIAHTTAESDAAFKREANKKCRKIEKAKLKDLTMLGPDAIMEAAEEFTTTELREVSDEWLSEKDEKQRINEENPFFHKSLRK